MGLAFFRAVLASLLFVAACSSRAAGDAPAQTSIKPAEECLSYAQAMRSCYAAIGAPTAAADALANAAAAPADDNERARMNAACVRDRAALRASCK